MAAVPFYLYLGDYSCCGTLTFEQIPKVSNTSGLSAGFQLLAGGPALNWWSFGLNDWRIMQTVPETPGGGGGLAYLPWWDGRAAAGAGAWRKYHHIGSGDGGLVPPFVADMEGDNWFDTGLRTFGGSALLAYLLGQKHANPTGFKLLKYAQALASFGGKVNVAGVTTTAAATTIVRASGSWVTDGYEIGDLVNITGTTSDNGFRTVTNVTALTLTVGGANFVGSATATVRANKWNDGSAYDRFAANYTAAVAAMAPDTPDLKAIVLDASLSDIRRLNTSYVNDVIAAIVQIRTLIGDLTGSVPVFLVNHNARMLETSKRLTVGTYDVAMALYLRTLNTALRTEFQNVYLVDMNSAELAPETFGSFALEPSDPSNYRPVEHLLLGQKIYNAIVARETAAPSATPGSGIATYFLIGDSQAVGTIPVTHAVLADQASMLGSGPGYVRSGQYIWNDVNRQIELYDLTQNANTLGTTSSVFYGPEAAMLRRLAEENPDGVLLIKMAQAGACVALESIADAQANFGLTINSYDPALNTLWEDLQEAWNDAKEACIRDLGRVPDLRGIALLLGDNDSYGTAGAAAFGTKFAAFVNELRSTLRTRTSGPATPVTNHLPPAHVSATEPGQSVLGQAGPKTTVRAAIAALPNRDERFQTVSDANLELLRTDRIHYGGEANHEIGLRLAEKLLELETE